MTSNIVTPLVQVGRDSSFRQRFTEALRPTTFALLLAALSLTAACGGGSGGEGSDVAGGSTGGSVAGSPSNSGTTTPGTDTGTATATATGTGTGTGTATGTATGGGAVPSNAAFSCSFATTFGDCGFGEQAKVPGRATMVNVAGVNAVRLHTESGDNNVAGSGDYERNDLTLNQASTDGYEGKTHWWAHSVRFPDEYVAPPISVATWNGGVVADFHNTTNGAGQANFQVQAMPATATSPDRPTGLSFQIAYGVQDSPTTQNFPIGPVERNIWYNFVYHVKWTAGSDGYVDAWVNGVQMLAYRGPTLYAGQGVYLKLANYHSPFGQASSVLHGRVIRSDTPLDVSAGL